MKRSLLVPLALLVVAFLLSQHLREATGFHGSVKAASGEGASGSTGSASLEGSAGAPSAISATHDSLFGFATPPADWNEVLRRLPAPARRVECVRLNLRLIEGKDSPLWKPGRGHIDLPLPGGGSLVATVDHSEMLDTVRIAIQGHVEGQPASRVLITGGREGQYAVSILDYSDPATGLMRSFALRPYGAGLAQFYEVDEGRVGSCARPGFDPTSYADWLADKVERRAQALLAEPEFSSPAAAAAMSPSGDPIIDVLFCHNQSVYGTPAAIAAVIDGVVLKVNSDFSRSLVKASIRLAGILPLTYTESYAGGSINTNALSALKDPADGLMDAVHAERDRVGADLVCLLLGMDDSSSIGVGYLTDTPTLVDTSSAHTNDQYAFTVCSYSQVQSTWVVSHELGHNLGAAHDRQNASGQGAFSYSYGYRFYGQNGIQYRTIMAYAPGSKLNYFSNPDIIPPEPGVAVPVGKAPGTVGEAHNALTLNRTAMEIANFRMQVQTPPSPGKLVNVSTRGWCGPGDQQMICGFQVGGSSSKTVLLRGMGDSLLRYGVAGTIANPRMTLHEFPSGAVVCRNDDWSVQDPGLPSGTSLRQRASELQMFEFDLLGMKETALLPTLPSGWYTANVEPSTGEGGVGLVEAYEADGNAGPRMLALSTRAYADVGKELIAGFVISGNPGETKRVLIRALGPTLGASPWNLPNAMFDPMIELHSADGTLVLVNDDWTASASSVGGTRDDFRPLVRYYSEKAIQATGQAPSNRREPAMLVDLQPGTYTAIVKPFSDPPYQLAEPGIATVEVFEIAQ